MKLNIFSEGKRKQILAGVLATLLISGATVPSVKALALGDSEMLHQVREVQKIVTKALNAQKQGIYPDNWRGDELLPSDTELKKELDIKQVIGNEYLNMKMILKNNGDVLALGEGKYLGLKEDAKKWTKLPVKGVKKLYTSGYNTFALCKNGDIWSVGSENSYGQRAVGDTEAHTGWTKVNIDGVKDIAVGIYCVAFLKSNGDVWGAGYGNYLGMKGNVTRPIKLAIDNVKHIYGSSSKHHGGFSVDYDSIWCIRKNGEVRRNITNKITTLSLQDVAYICNTPVCNWNSYKSYGGIGVVLKNGEYYEFYNDDEEYKQLSERSGNKKLTDVKKVLSGKIMDDSLIYEDIKGIVKCRKHWGTNPIPEKNKLKDNSEYDYIRDKWFSYNKDGTLWCEDLLGSYESKREDMTCLNSIILNDTRDTLNSVYDYKDLIKYQELKLGLLGRERYTKEHIYIADGKVNKLFDLSDEDKETKYIFRCQNGDAFVQTKDNPNTIQFYKMGEMSPKPVTGKTDTQISRAFTGVVDTKIVPMVELKDSKIAWLDGTELKELPLTKKEIKSNFLFRTKDGVKMFFQKTDGSLWWYNSNCEAQEVLGINMRHVKDICKGQYGNTDLFVMDDATLNTAERPLLTDGRKVVERLSDGFLRLNDDKIYARTGDLDLKVIIDSKGENIKPINMKGITNKFIWGGYGDGEGFVANTKQPYNSYTCKGIKYWNSEDTLVASKEHKVMDLSDDLALDVSSGKTLLLSYSDTYNSSSRERYYVTTDLSKEIPDYKQIIGAYYIGETEYLLMKDGTFRSITDGKPLTTVRLVGNTIGKLKSKSKLVFDVAKDAKEAIIELESGDLSNATNVKNMIDSIKDEGTRKELWERYKKALTKAEPVFNDINNLIDEFTSKPSRDVLDRLDIAVLKIKDETLQADYKEMVEAMKEKYKDKLIREATEAIDKADKFPTQESFDLAEKAVNKMEKGDDQDDLKTRLEEIKALVKENEEALKAVAKSLAQYKSEPTNEHYEAVKSDIAKLGSKDLKENAEKELEEAYQKALIDECEPLVEKAEDSRLLRDVETTTAKVDLITDKQIKEGFTKRLQAISTSSNPANVDKTNELDEVSKLVNKAVASGSAEDVQKAKESIDKLKYLDNKFTFNSKLATVEQNVPVDPKPFSEPKSAETQFQVRMGVLPNITIKTDKPFVDLGNIDLVKTKTLKDPIHVLVNSNMPYDVYAKSEDIKAVQGNQVITPEHLSMGLDDNNIRPMSKTSEVLLAKVNETGDKVFGTKFEFKQDKDAKPGLYKTIIKLIARQR